MNIEEDKPIEDIRTQTEETKPLTEETKEEKPKEEIIPSSQETKEEIPSEEQKEMEKEKNIILMAFLNLRKNI